MSVTITKKGASSRKLSLLVEWDGQYPDTSTTLSNSFLVENMPDGDLGVLWGYAYPTAVDARDNLLGFSKFGLVFPLPILGASPWVLSTSVDSEGRASLTVDAQGGSSPASCFLNFVVLSV